VIAPINVQAGINARQQHLTSDGIMTFHIFCCSAQFQIGPFKLSLSSVIKTVESVFTLLRSTSHDGVRLTDTMLYILYMFIEILSKQHMHHPLIHSPLYSINKESPDTADTQSSKEDRQTFFTIRLLCNLNCSQST
jgi:hypothetical protein